MLKKNLTRATAVFMSAGLALGLAACGGGSQSTAQACDILESEMKKIEEELETAMTGADMSGLGDMFTPMVKQLDSAAGKITNDEVKAAATEFGKQLTTFSDLFSKLDLENLDFTDEDAMKEFEAVSAQIEESSSGLEAATDKISTLCEF